jgi:integrase
MLVASLTARDLMAAKREWGKGSIEERGPDKWLIRVSYRSNPITKQQIRESRVVHGKRKDAEHALDELLAQKNVSGTAPAKGGKVTLDKWVRDQITAGLSKKGKPLSARTRIDQVYVWEHYSSPSLRSTLLRDVTTDQLEKHVAHLYERVSEKTGRPLGPRTVQIFFNIVRACLAAAVRKHALRTNPATGLAVEGGTATSKVGQALSPEEMQRFLEHDPEDRLRALWYVAAYTGVRPAELLALRWEDWENWDWDDKAGVLQVRRSLVRAGKERVFAPCKSKSERTVPVAPELATVLREHRKRQLTERVRLGEKWIDPSLMFTNEIGSALEQHNASNAFRARLKAAKVKPVRWYDLRHSFGTHMIASGTDAKTVAALMGHVKVTMTLQHYAHPDDAGKQAAVARLPWNAVANGGAR